MNEVTVLSSWSSAIFFTSQIYFDSSGYSDMAIGLGYTFGFKFLENFNYPYIAKSITDFWRRWHISLSSWLRDYVYIPLGGNRCSKIKWMRNIFVVWFLTGFWHGAAWNFIIWGLYFGIILVIEKKFLLEFLKKHKIISHIYTMFLVIISFVIFNANSFTEVINFMKNMFGLNNLPFINQETIYYLKSYITMIIISSIAATPLLKNICIKLKENSKIDKIMNVLEILFVFTVLILVTSFLIDSSFNPFLYFRF
jgi:alginate O-acetyltransferase complex protein AlgI